MNKKNHDKNDFPVVIQVVAIILLVAIGLFLLFSFSSCTIPGEISVQGDDFTLQVKGNMSLEISLLPIPIILRIEGRSVLSLEGKIVGKTHADGIILQAGDTICTLLVTDVTENGVFGTVACEAAAGATAEAMFVLRPLKETGGDDILSWIKKIWPRLNIIKFMDGH